MTVKIGTRGSDLALWQANFVKNELAQHGVEAELHIIKTKGDRIQHLSFDKIEGKGFFTKEIEDALLAGEVDLAVHSMKDMPTTQPEGLVLAGVSYRETPIDWLLIPKATAVGKGFAGLRQNAVVGTSSARRKALMLDLRPDVTLKDIRGNVPTRIGKLRDGQFDAILLAGAGLVRLSIDIEDMYTIQFDPSEFVPAPAQGVLTYQCRLDDLPTRRLLKKLHHPEVAACTNVERSVLKLIGGGCHAPLGVHCELDGDGNYHVDAAYAIAWDQPLRRAKLSSTTSIGLAEAVVEKLGIEKTAKPT